jgi:hypothetical protein
MFSISGAPLFACSRFTGQLEDSEKCREHEMICNASDSVQIGAKRGKARRSDHGRDLTPPQVTEKNKEQNKDETMKSG